MGIDIPFVYLADLSVPTTDESEIAAADPGRNGLDIISVDALGLVILTQTCDIVRKCEDRPYVEVCLLVEMLEDQVDLINRGRVPRFAPLPALRKPNLAADLDRVMTIEKGLLLAVASRRASGVSTEAEARNFTEALGRKRTRPALPNELTFAVGPMRRRILDKHSKQTEEGDFLRSVKEIRVRPRPDWTSATIEIEFLFVFERAQRIPPDAEDFIQPLIDRVMKSTWIVDVEGRAVGLDELSAASYLESYRLDLDNLSYQP